MRDFKKMQCWNLGMEIVGLVYELLERLPSSGIQKILRSRWDRSNVGLESRLT